MAEDKDKEVKRLNYFKGLFLQEDDFNAEQAYHIRMRRLHNRALHTWGVVEGLVVSQGSSANSVVVAPGIAIDNEGQEIVQPVSSPPIPITGVTNGDVFITVSYAEVDDPSDKYTTAGVENKFKKKTERPLLKADAAAPAAGSLAVLLAKVTVGGGLVTAISNEVRRLANSALFSSMDLEVRSLKWGNNRLQADQGGSIELGGDGTTPGTGTPYIDFHFGPKAAEDFNVRLINDANGTLSIQGKVLQVTGSAGIGTPTPGARLTIQQGSTPAGSAANGKGLFVSAPMGTGAASDGGIEFRRDDLTQGIGFGYNTIYATGSNANQDLAIQSRGTGSVLLNPAAGNVGIGSASAPRAKLQVTGGAIMPAAGNSETSGIMFPKDPGLGSGDAAWIRYYARTGEPSTENTTLEIGTSNDPQDHIALMASGNVGVGIVNPTKKLTVSTSATSPDGVLVAGSDNHFALTAPSLGQGSFNGITRAGDAGIIYSGGTPGTGAFVIAPWADAVSGLRIDANGNVGLGIAAPIDKLHVEAGSILIRGEGTGLIVDEGPNKRVGFLKYAGREAGIWRLNAQDFEIGRLNPEVTSLPGAPTAFTTDLSVGANGSVGIGTPTPDRNLTITRTPAQNERPSAVEGIYANVKNVTHEILIGVDSAAILSAMTASDLQFRTNNITRMLIQANTGNVGIGNTAPNEKLAVEGNIRLNEQSSLLLRSGADPNHGIGYFGSARPFASQVVDGPVVFGWLGGILGTTAGGPRVTLRWNSGGGVDVGPVAMPGIQGRLMVSGTTAEVGFLRRNLTVWPATPVPGDRFLWYNQEGSMARLWTEGVGDLLTVSTAGDLSITGAFRAGNSDIYFTKTDHKHTGIGNAVGFAAIENAIDPYNALMILGRNVGTADKIDRRVKVWDQLEVAGNIGTQGRPAAAKKAGWIGGVRTFDVEAEGMIWSAKGIDTTPHDIAENYLSDSDLAPGDVVCLDKERDRIIKSEKANDTLLIGVISTEPGMLLNAMHAEEDSVPGMLPYPVALCGRVPCKVTDENGSIERGELLTTSSTPGHAMKATPVQVKGIDIYRPGTVIGKALEHHKSGKGMIEVFVALR